MPSRNWDEGNSGRVVADLLDVGADFLGDLLITSLAVGGLSGVHLVDSNDELFHSQGESQEGMFTGLSVLRDTSLELTNTTSNNQHGTVSLEGRKKAMKLNLTTLLTKAVLCGWNVVIPEKYQ